MATHTAYHQYSKSDVEEIVCSAARNAMVGRIYVGEIYKQEIFWGADGSAMVLTHHKPGAQRI
jgi:hypothetical protein